MMWPCLEDVTAVIKYMRRYEERLAKIEMPSMKSRQMREDMIMVYKVLNGYDPLLEHSFAFDKNSITREHNFKLKKPPFKSTIHQKFLIAVS